MKGTLQNYYKGDPKEDARAAAAEGTSTAHPTGSSNPRELASTAAQDRLRGESSGVNAIGGAVAAADTLKHRVNENVDQETKDKARDKHNEYRERTREYFSRKMPQERRDQTVWRLKKMVLECQQHPDYHRAIQTLLDLAEEYGDHANRMAKGGSSTVMDARSGLYQAESDLKVCSTLPMRENSVADNLL